MVTVSSQNKPLAVFHLIKSLNKVLCFTATIETANRLALVMRLFGKKLGMRFFSVFLALLCNIYFLFLGLESTFRCGKFSSKMTAKQRNTVLKRFKEGDINV